MDWAMLNRQWGSQGSLHVCLICIGILSFLQLWHLTCTITHVPKPSNQDQKGDQGGCLKIPPITTVLKDATLLCTSRSPHSPKSAFQQLWLSPALYSPCWWAETLGLCRGSGDTAITSGQGHGAEKGIAGLRFERLLCANGSLGFKGTASHPGVPRHPSASAPTLSPSHTYLPSAPWQAGGMGVPTPWRRICLAGISTASFLMLPPHCRLPVPHLSLPQEVWVPHFNLVCSLSQQALPLPCHKSSPSPSLSFAPDLWLQ